MSKKITIKEEDVEEPYDEIIEQVDNTPEPPPPEPAPPPTSRIPVVTRRRRK